LDKPSLIGKKLFT